MKSGLSPLIRNGAYLILLLSPPTATSVFGQEQSPGQPTDAAQLAPNPIQSSIHPAMDAAQLAPASAQLAPSPAKLEGGVTIKKVDVPLHEPPVEEADANSDKKKDSILHKVGAKGKSLANFVFDLRGFDWSKEGANAISDQNIDPKNDAAKEYIFRKKCDDQEIRKAALIMQMAMYMDRDEKKTNQALDDLEKLRGKQEAIETYRGIQHLSGEDLNLADQRLELDFMQKGVALGRILEKTATSDPVLIDVSKKLSKYNHRSKITQISAKVVYSTLGIATFTPTLVAPIAEAALLSFMMATGGPEQDKLLKEIYLGKIMQSRCNALNEKAHIAIDGMDMALLSKNKRLLACTKALIADLSDEEMAASVVGPFNVTQNAALQSASEH